VIGSSAAAPRRRLGTQRRRSRPRRREGEAFCQAGVGVCIVADRGFGDQNLYRLLTEELHFEYVIRFRGNIKVTAANGAGTEPTSWSSHQESFLCGRHSHCCGLGEPGAGGRVCCAGAMVTADRYPVANSRKLPQSERLR